MKSKSKRDRESRLRESLGLSESVDKAPLYEVKKQPFKYAPLFVMTFVITAVIVFYSLFIPVRVSGESMDPTLKDNQWLLIKKGEDVRRFDIAVLKERLIDGGETVTIVKRIIGMPGDVVTVVDGVLYVNNDQYDEDYLVDEHIEYFNEVDFTITVPEDHVFVLGDNRDVSKDSRAVGCFKKSAIVGVMLFND